MTVSQTGTIDWLGIEKGSGHVSLTIVDDLDWTDAQEHLLLLQAKLNTYLAFIESGEVFERLAEELDRTVPRSTPLRVSVLAKFELPPRARAFLSHASEMFGRAGLVLDRRVVRM